MKVARKTVAKLITSYHALCNTPILNPRLSFLLFFMNKEQEFIFKKNYYKEFLFLF